jgi:hypothetical protein
MPPGEYLFALPFLVGGIQLAAMSAIDWYVLGGACEDLISGQVVYNRVKKCSNEAKQNEEKVPVSELPGGC